MSVFADDARADGGVFHLYYVFALDAAHGFIILRVPVSPDRPEFASLTNAIPAVNWQEREIQDLFGLQTDRPSEPAPLRAARRLAGSLSAAQGFRFADRNCRRSRASATNSATVEGEGVFQVPVGPVHAGIIEPGHFLFSVAGEPVLYLQLRMFYTHKGTEKLFENMPVPHGVRLAESISGDSSFAHATAFCHAVERAAGVEAPPRARALRTRLPRTGAPLQPHRRHRRDCTDVAFVAANMHAMRLKETRAAAQRTPDRQPPVARHGLARAACVPIWTRSNSRPLAAACRPNCEPEFESLVELIEDSSSTRDRLETTGVLKPEVAREPRRRRHRRAAPPVSTTICAAIFRTPPTTGEIHASRFISAGDVQHRMQRAHRRSAPVARHYRQVLAALARRRHARVDLAELPAGRGRAGLCRRLARGNFSLDSHRARQPAGALQDQRPVAAKLAGAERGDPGQHHPGFSGRQQKLQPVLFGNRPLIYV